MLNLIKYLKSIIIGEIIIGDKKDMNNILPKAQDIHNTLMELFLSQDKLDSDNKPLPDTKFFVAKGLTKQLALDPTKLNDAKLKKILKWKSEMSPNFYKGDSFLNMPFDAKGNQWGEQVNAEELLYLLEVAGLADIMTDVPTVFLPGHVPYIKIYRNRKPIFMTTMRELRARRIN